MVVIITIGAIKMKLKQSVKGLMLACAITSIGLSGAALAGHPGHPGGHGGHGGHGHYHPHHWHYNHWHRWHRWHRAYYPYAVNPFWAPSPVVVYRPAPGVRFIIR